MPETKSAILRLLLQGERTARMLASKTGIHFSVIRRHLEEMKGVNLVESRFEKKARGRPEKLYRLTAEGRKVLGAKYDLLLDLVTEAAVNNTDLRESRRLFTSAAQNLAKRVGSPKDLNSAMQLLRDFGFYPDRTTETGKEFIISYNCPFFSVAEKYPELSCETFHSTFLKNLLGASKVTLEATMARGAPRCVHGVGFAPHVKRDPIRT